MGTGKLSGKPDLMLGVTCDELASHPGEVAILPIASCYGYRDKPLQYWSTRLVRLNLTLLSQDRYSVTTFNTAWDTSYTTNTNHNSTVASP